MSVFKHLQDSTGKIGRKALQSLYYSASALPSNRLDFQQLTHQVYFIGVLTSPIIILSSLFIGAVLALQGNYILSMFASENQLGQMITLTTFRELGPVISSLLFIGRAGTAITAEIGSMRLHEQLDALSSLAIPPQRYCFMPRLLAGAITLPLLCILFNTFTLIGGYLVAIYWLHLDQGLFWIDIKGSAKFYEDILPGLFKAFCFSIIIGMVAINRGLKADKSAQGVAKATTATVVIASISILFADLLLTILLMRTWV